MVRAELIYLCIMIRSLGKVKLSMDKYNGNLIVHGQVPTFAISTPLHSGGALFTHFVFLNHFLPAICQLYHKDPFSFHTVLEHPGDKNISILHSPCRTSDLQFSHVLQTHALVLKNCMQ